MRFSRGGSLVAVALLAAAGCVDQAEMDRAMAAKDAEIARLAREQQEGRLALAECREALSDRGERASALAPLPPYAPRTAPVSAPAPVPAPAPAPPAVAPAPPAMAPVSPVVLPAPDTGEEPSYRHALAMIQARQPVAARAALADFLRRFPQSKLRPNALFWMAEADFQEEHWEAARRGFLGLAGEFETHQKTADALYKAALCSLKLNDNMSAIGQLNAVVKRFPKSDAAGFARKKLAEMGK